MPTEINCNNEECIFNDDGEGCTEREIEVNENGQCITMELDENI